MNMPKISLAQCIAIPEDRRAYKQHIDYSDSFVFLREQKVSPVNRTEEQQRIHHQRRRVSQPRVGSEIPRMKIYPPVKETP